ncbi:hypothetical protein [uncultured Treponema sp.]|uniref:hypothetical protein n=1 Tax=uncultured Treponema sp. TaxID=162155 RepID=UPI0025925C5F|nr:hypothetical protein [uncultured Treponema sp.]
MRKKIKINLAAKKRFTVIFLTFIMLTVLSCNFSDDLDDSKHSGGQEKYVTVCGTFALQGAVPSSLRSKPGTRSAVPSLPEGISCAVTAKSAKNETMEASYAGSDGLFEIKLTQGEWTLSAEIKNGEKTILSGKSDKISITTAKPIEDKIIIILKPDSSSGSGTVNLPVTIENTSGIKSAQVSWTGSSAGITGITGNQTLDFSSNTSAAFTMGGTDISSGAYTAVFQFYSEESDGTNRLLFQCTETINVCANLCTDSWVKNGTNSSAWLKENDGKATFTVTKSLVEKFAQISFFVQGTGGTYTPKTTASDKNNGTYFDPLSTVQKAVDKIIQINDGETEYSIFIDGTVTAPDTLNSSTTLNFIKIEPQKKLKLKIVSLSSTQAVINANKKARVIYVIGESETEKTTLVLQNVCITGGETQSSGVGGGLKAQYADITLKAGTVIGTKLNPEENKAKVANSLTYGNYAAKGGGIYLNGCTLTIENDVYICQNYSENEGGGIAAEGNSKILATGGIIGFNQASSGGGIYITDGSAELTDCTVSLNKANSNGGGIYIDGSSLTLNGGTVVGDKNATQTAASSAYSNYAFLSGGGIYAINTTVIMNEESCVMYNVTYRDSGGGLYVKNGNLTIKKAKINYNYSSIAAYQGSGGGLRLAGSASMTIEGDSEIAYNGSAFKGAGIQLIGTSSCTMNSGSIHYNKNYSSYGGEEGGGVCISSDTATFSMNGGKISGNTHGTSSYGDAIYVAGTLNLSSNVCIAPDNDVYLASGTFVTLTGKLTGESPVATLTPNEYTEARTMLKSGGSYILIQDDCDKFAVTKDSVNNKFYRVSFDTYSNCGILKESKLKAKSELSGIKFIPSTSLIYFSKVQAGGQKISFSVQKKTADSTGTTYTKVTPSSAKIALYQNGSKLTNHSAEASNNLPELTLASWLPEGKYNLYMSATVDGVEYSAWETFVITSKIPISSLTSAPDSKYYPHLAAETGEDLKNLNEWMQGGSTMEGITITLTKDIDLTSETEWQPIGYTGDSDANFNEKNGTSFKGTLDGNGKSVQFKINSSTQKMIGLFLKNEGTIENLVVEQYTADGTQIGSSSSNLSRGGAFCVINNGTIRNCINKANFKVYTFWDVGGICMLNYGTIENCLNTGNITMTNNASTWGGSYQKSGGIAGQNEGNMYNCVNKGTISTNPLVDASNQQSNLSGTISSMLIKDAQIKNCYWLKDCLSRGSLKNNQAVYFKSSGTSYVESFPDTATVEGCGYFESFTASAALTAGDADSCKSTQTLSYGTTLLEALNGYVSANPGRELKQWQANADGSITIGF